MTSIARSPSTPKPGGFSMPDWKPFVLPYGPGTDEGYAGAAANAFGGMMTEYMKQPANFAGILGGLYGTATGGRTQAYDTYAGGLGQIGQNTANAYGTQGNAMAGLGNAAAGALGAYGQGMSGMGNSVAGMYNSYNQGQAAAGQSAAGMYDSYANATAGLGNAQASAMGAMGQGLGGVAQGQAMADAARYGAAASMGAAALGAYGSASNSALSAWAQNQMAYNKALSDMQGANQSAVSNVGVSRNQALGGLGDAYGRLAGADAAMNLAGTFNGQTPGAGFSATGTDGSIASGSFGGSSGGSGSISGSITGGSTDRGYAGIDALRADIGSGGVLGQLAAANASGMDRLDAQHYSSREMPMTALGDILSGIRTLGSDGYSQLGSANYGSYNNALQSAFGTTTDRLAASQDALGSGMSEPMGLLRESMNNSAAGFGTALSPLVSGMNNLGSAYTDTSGTINRGMDSVNFGLGQTLGALGDLARGLEAGYEDTTSAIDDGYDTARGDVTSLWDSLRPMSPAEQARQAREAEMLQRQYGNQDAEALLASYRGREWAIPGDLAKKAGLIRGPSGYYNPWSTSNSTGPAAKPFDLAANWVGRPINPRGDLAPNPFVLS
jgi:hypothetical protein